MAMAIGLDRHLLLGRGETDAGGATRPSVLAGCFEALAGALSMTVGTERAEAVLESLFSPHLDALASIEGAPKSAKSLLQEWSQRYRGLKPNYQLLETSGPPHDQRFRVAVMVDGAAMGYGHGSSRQRAEEQAAGAALTELPEVSGGTEQHTAS